MPQYDQRVFIRGRQEAGSQKKAAWWQKQRVRTGEPRGRAAGLEVEGEASC